jgi:hypothetical protein
MHILYPPLFTVISATITHDEIEELHMKLDMCMRVYMILR